MEETDQLPLKRVEVSLTRFNDVAIPHHLDLLRQHKANILKHSAEGAWARVRGEQAAAARAAARLRALLLEMDALRRRVRPDQRARFDRLTRRARDDTLRAIADYLGTSPLAMERAARGAGAAGQPGEAGHGELAASAASTDSVGVVSPADGDGDGDADWPQLQGQVQLQVDEQQVALQEREALLRGWGALQAEVRALHDAWQTTQAAALAQRGHVATAAAHVDEAADNVAAAGTDLASAERLRAGALSAGGAALGAALGGPVGLVVGAKAGAAAALAGSLLGWLGVRWMRRRQLDGDRDRDRDKRD